MPAATMKWLPADGDNTAVSIETDDSLTANNTVNIKRLKTVLTLCGESNPSSSPFDCQHDSS